MAQTYVALDLETTGLDPLRDAIVEVGAVRFRGEQVLETYSSFVNPGRRIPPEITELTGITDDDVAGAPSVHTVLASLAHFVDDLPLVGHSIGFDLGFLRQRSPLFRNPAYDTFELAGVLLPDAERFSLTELTSRFDIGAEHAHRALADALATQRLFGVLCQRATALPVRLLKEIVAHGTRAGWEATSFFRTALEQVAAAGRSADLPREGLAAGGLQWPLSLSEAAAVEAIAPLEPLEGRRPLDTDKLAALFGEDGALARAWPGYECRPQQVAMLRRVAHTFNTGGQLLVEAPTGVGKSLAYLVPAAAWAIQNGERVVISTNTINLQEQLLYKDIPQLAGVLPDRVRAVVLKGRSHYLCPARLAALRRRGPASPEQARVLAKVLVWLSQSGTRDGDGDALFLPGATEQAIWRDMSAEFESCDPDRCPHLRSNACFFYRARRQAEAAHLIVVNHALLLADTAVENRALPEHRYLIVDEAHHLEEAATSSLSFELSCAQVRRLLGRVGGVNQSGRVVGLLANVLGAFHRAYRDPISLGRIELLVGRVGVASERSGSALETLFDRLSAFLREHADGRRGQSDVRLRVTGALRVQPGWDAVEMAWDDAEKPLRALVDGLERLAREIGTAALDPADREDLHVQLLASARELATVQAQIGQVIVAHSPSQVCWLTAGTGNGNSGTDELSLHAAPVRVGTLIEEHIHRKKEAVILTSATLRTADSFDFVRDQLGAWDADELVVDSPFDYRNSTLVYLVDDIPEPERPGYQRALEQGLVALFRATGGRALGLFTSYNALRTTQRAIKAPLAQAGITVQAQGEGISRRQLLENFRGGDRRVLLGTRSFWEGVDVVGEALSCLAIAKLPFSVPTDPIFAARAESYDDPFTEYAVPEAILRFLQGFGRLIRSRTDRGVVAVFDVRLLTKSYGDLFIQSLPGPTVRRGPLAQLPQAAELWLRSA